MNTLKIISLNGCGYSMAAEEFIKSINNDKMKVNIKRISQLEKNDYKNKDINTFPQIYFSNNNKDILIGGYEKLKEMYDGLIDIKLSNQGQKQDLMIKYLDSKIDKLRRREKLRLIIFLIG